MIMRLTDQQFKTLAQWGHAHGIESCDDACHLLLSMILECCGDPKTADAVSKPSDPRAKTWNGVRVYSKYVRIPTFKASPRTRALWLWGARRGEPNIAASLRALVDLLGHTWQPSNTTEANLAAFVDAVGLEQSAA